MMITRQHRDQNRQTMIATTITASPWQYTTYSTSTSIVSFREMDTADDVDT